MANGKSDYYDILGVTKSASADELKRAYRKQALEWHPDRHKDDKEAAEKRFKEINEAYQVLSDPQKKSAYDRFGHQAFEPGGGFGRAGGGSPFAGQGGQWGPFTYTYSTSGGDGSPFAGYDFSDPFDIFESFFGGGNPFRQTRKQIQRYSIAIDFMEAVNGVEKEVTVEGKRRKIKIPAGVDEGQRIRFDDFILSINIRPHELFEREASDIYIKMEISFSTAILGGTIEVPTLDGSVKIKIRPGTQSGTVVRLRGKGIASIQSRAKGDEYVRLLIQTPDHLTREQRDLVNGLKREGL
ncbi:MAG: Chaperone protein DnaJ [Candidatus Woesebacteria bacterium GW2011_GWA1_39_21]|uniref:Chaperone protein DnaJ n=1 Tax=Candidatus Woesebacteria bacterium GW2011_GWA1_39_21 TaxID=1618550 RepID=A0A0G0N8C3_9BACT|nr:MAG: Chaperone protein DnaJ [Candidatus Woesebacteria bacterium GW2011_GWA1_39_21]